MSTGKGDFPFKSAWFLRGRYRGRGLTPSVGEQAIPLEQVGYVALSNFFFEGVSGGGVTGVVSTSQAQTIQATGNVTAPVVTGTITTSQAQTISASGNFTPAGVSGNITASQAQTAQASGSFTPQAVTGNATSSQAQTIAASGSFTPQAVTGNISSSQAQTISATGTFTLAAVSGTVTTSQAQTVSAIGNVTGSVQNAGKTKRFYVDDVPYDIPVTEIDFFLKNLPKKEEKEPQKIAIQAVKKTGEAVRAESSIKTPAYEAFKSLVFKQIEIPAFDYKALLEFQQKRDAELAVLAALELEAQQQAELAYKNKLKARLYALLLE